MAMCLGSEIDWQDRAILVRGTGMGQMMTRVHHDRIYKVFIKLQISIVQAISHSYLGLPVICSVAEFLIGGSGRLCHIRAEHTIDGTPVGLQTTMSHKPVPWLTPTEPRCMNAGCIYKVPRSVVSEMQV